MVYIKKLLSVVLAVAVLLSMAVPAVAASEFSDLEGHWAKSYMEKLYKKGYLSGYTDGTMRPDNAITGCEALVFLSRFYELSSREKEFITADYGTKAKASLSSSLQWAVPEVSVCLAAGIITENELKTANLSQKIEKQQLAVYLVRALGLEEEAKKKDGAELNFTDKASINASYLGHISVLVDIGIIQGDTTNQFTPKVTVTRAMAATMVSRGLDYLEEKSAVPHVPGYTGLDRITGILEEVNAKYIRVRGFDGKLREYKLPDEYTTKVNETKKNLTSDYEGCYVDLCAFNGAADEISITQSENVSYVVGRISAVSTGTNENSVSIYVPATGKTTQIKLAKNYALDITVDGAKADFSALKKNQFIIAKTDSLEVKQLSAAAGDYDLGGKVSEIIFGTTVQFKLTDANDTVFVYLFDIADLPTVKRGSTAITIDRLVKGDSITVEVESCSVDAIVSAAEAKAASGTLTTITTTLEGTWWTITDENGKENRYQLDTAASAYKGSKAIAVSEIAIGDKLSLVVYDTVITEVELVSAAVANDKISAIVLDINSKTLTCLVGSKLVYVDASSATLFDVSSGKTVKLSDLDAETAVTVYGGYKSAAKFTATSIVVE